MATHDAEFGRLLATGNKFVRFSLLNRTVFDELQALGEYAEKHAHEKVRGRNARAPRSVQLLGGMEQVRLFITLAVENGFQLANVGRNEDGIGGDFLVHLPGRPDLGLRIEAKPYDDAVTFYASVTSSAHLRARQWI